MSCHRRPAQDAQSASGTVLQWIFSDGLATVSLFIEDLIAGHHGPEGLRVMGATHTLSRSVPDKAGGWWLTVVGEVPAQTLQAFALALERRK
jgi:sigma-E factor negative regulatory protein RseB